MIAIHRQTVFIRFEDGRLVPLEPRQLRHSIRKAAHAAGYPHWLLANHVAAAIILYFERDWRAQTVHRTQLLEAITYVLTRIGYAGIADAYRQLYDRAVFDLAALAVQTTAGFDLEFYRLLGAQLEKACVAQPAQLEFRRLRDCVKILTGKRAWRASCQGFSDELLAFIRQKIAAHFQDRPCSFVVSR